MELKQKQQLADAAKMLAASYELVQHSSMTFIPAHWLSEEVEPLPEIKERIWLPLSRLEKRQLANVKANILFATDAELSSFDYMLRQFSSESDKATTDILVKTDKGLRLLTDEGKLEEPDGLFRPNYLKPKLNESKEDKAEVFAVLTNWLNSEEEAHSLLNHLATSLSPGWSAVKYVLLLGDGRNGKSVLLSMLADLYGRENVSNITRQQMAEQLPVCVELNNKLLNVVFDGRMDYVKDSGLEKTLIAGEPGYIRMLYESSTTRVQTNALFVEGLNKEPKSRDKSSALQKRLVRFWFPHVFQRDIAFEKHMRSEKMLGAFLSLLIDHYVCKDEVIEKLAPSAGAQELQMNQMWMNSPALQFLEQLVLKDPTLGDSLVGSNLEPLVNAFMAWRLNEGHSEYSSADTATMFKECFEINWKTARVNGKMSRVRRIISIKPEAQTLLNQVKEGEEDDAEVDEALVAD